MANYRIYKDGNEINKIVSDEEFCAEYCAENGYTYEQMNDPIPVPAPEPEPTDVWAELDAAYQQGYTEGVNSVE